MPPKDPISNFPLRSASYSANQIKKGATTSPSSTGKLLVCAFIMQASKTLVRSRPSEPVARIFYLSFMCFRPALSPSTKPTVRIQIPVQV